MFFLKGSTAINMSYFVSGILILVPLVIFLIRTRFKEVKYVVLSLTALLLALFLRYADDLNLIILPMGTHWLWHVFSGIGAWFMGLFIFRTSGSKTEQKDVLNRE
jgi:hypothetical protein